MFWYIFSLLPVHGTFKNLNHETYLLLCTGVTFYMQLDKMCSHVEQWKVLLIMFSNLLHFVFEFSRHPSTRFNIYAWRGCPVHAFLNLKFREIALGTSLVCTNKYLLYTVSLKSSFALREKKNFLLERCLKPRESCLSVSDDYFVLYLIQEKLFTS